MATSNSRKPRDEADRPPVETVYEVRDLDRPALPQTGIEGKASPGAVEEYEVEDLDKAARRIRRLREIADFTERTTGAVARLVYSIGALLLIILTLVGQLEGSQLLLGLVALVLIAGGHEAAGHRRARKLVKAVVTNLFGNDASDDETRGPDETSSPKQAREARGNGQRDSDRER